MPIKITEVQVGWIYKTPNNQERAVLGCNSDCKVVYASRGGYVQNEFIHREASTIERFAEACSEKVKELSDKELKNIIISCNASNVIIKDSICCFRSEEIKAE